MRRTCFITNEELDIRFMRKTDDGFWVKTDLYKLAVEELKQGVVTSNNIKQVLAILKLYNALILNLLRLTRKIAKIDSCSPIEILNDVIELEKEWSITSYNKDYKCLTRLEHINFLRYLLDTERYVAVNTPEIIDDINYDDTSYRKLYLKGRYFDDYY